MNSEPSEAPREEPPPLGSWLRLYALVVAWLLAQIALLGIVTWSFR